MVVVFLSFHLLEIHMEVFTNEMTWYLRFTLKYSSGRGEACASVRKRACVHMYTFAYENR